MKLSIITPSYNQGRFIERTILSVLQQPLPDVEYWVIDGGSTDETLEVLEKYQDRLHWISEPDRGQTDALNKGILRTSGEIIGWLNSDDVYYPAVLPRVLQFFADHPEVNIVYGRGYHIDVEDRIINEYPTREWDYQRLWDDCFICQPAVFFRRQLIDRHGLFDESLQYCMDYEYWLRVGAKEPMTFLPEILAGSRLYETNKTLGARRQVREEIQTMICRRRGYPSLKWSVSLGQVEANESGLRRDGPIQAARFILAVYKVVVREYKARNASLSANEVARFGLWCLGRFGRVLRGRGMSQGWPQHWKNG